MPQRIRRNSSHFAPPPPGLRGHDGCSGRLAMNRTPRSMLAAAIGEAEQEYRAAQLAVRLKQAGAEDQLAASRERLRYLHRAAERRGQEATGEITLPPEVLAIRSGSS